MRSEEILSKRRKEELKQLEKKIADYQEKMQRRSRENGKKRMYGEKERKQRESSGKCKELE